MDDDSFIISPARELASLGAKPDELKHTRGAEPYKAINLSADRGQQSLTIISWWPRRRPRSVAVRRLMTAAKIVPDDLLVQAIAGHGMACDPVMTELKKQARRYIRSTCLTPCLGSEDPRKELLLDHRLRCLFQSEQGTPVPLSSQNRFLPGHARSTHPEGVVVPTMHGTTSKSFAIVVGATTVGGQGPAARRGLAKH